MLLLIFLNSCQQIFSSLDLLLLLQQDFFSPLILSEIHFWRYEIKINKRFGQSCFPNFRPTYDQSFKVFHLQDLHNFSLRSLTGPFTCLASFPLLSLFGPRFLCSFFNSLLSVVLGLNLIFGCILKLFALWSFRLNLWLRVRREIDQVKVRLELRLESLFPKAVGGVVGVPRLLVTFVFIF